MCVHAHVRACVCVCVHTHHIFLIRSSVDGHLGFFHVLATVNSAAMNMRVHVFFFFVVVVISWAAPAAYGGSQARGPIGAVATGLRQSHSNPGSEPRLQPTPQLTATPDRQPTEQGQGPNLQPHGSQSDSLTTAPRRELPNQV